MNNIWVRPARQEDSKNFAEWFVKMPSFTEQIFQFPETYTLCAFNPKILAYGIVSFGHGIQVISRVIVNPEASRLEQAAASKELVKTVVTFGYINNLREIYFMGDHPGTNQIASHGFKSIMPFEYKFIWPESEYPVYRLILGDLECQT